jgi:hypothetical protein
VLTATFKATRKDSFPSFSAVVPNDHRELPLQALPLIKIRWSNKFDPTFLLTAGMRFVKNVDLPTQYRRRATSTLSHYPAGWAESAKPNLQILTFV